ncbi:MAG TPA: GGDEF domain-containing protein [Candidatus Nanoarchaeia archaeon]|nr:GGDEF domain-containing protein [Candidatus Nanoarchaeia archaeon]
MFISLIALAAILFAIFSFITIRTNVNVLSESIIALKGALSGSFAEALANMQQSLSRVYTIALTETLILLGSILSSLFAIGYLINIYYYTIRTSLLDELTGIYNRRALYRILDHEIKRAERFRHPLTIVMLDIDFFKIFNDKNGHIAGDMLLKRLSRILTKKIRDVDTLARYGGEEFLIILPETPHDSAVRIAERIRKTVEQTYFEGQETQPKGKVTLSMGLVTYHGEYKERTHLIHSADELLYKAKEQGRNQLIKAYYKDHKFIASEKKK